MTDLSQVSNDDLLKMYQQPDPRGLVTDAARKHGIPEDMLHRLADQESRYDPRAVSPAGAKGVMQLMDPTAAELGVTDPFDPVQNIDAGARYLRQQYDRFGDWKLAAAAYNAGPGRVEKAGGVPNIPETVNYVSKVVGDGGDGSDLGNMSNEELLALYGQPEAAAGQQAGGWEEVGASHNRGVTVELPSQSPAQDQAGSANVGSSPVGKTSQFLGFAKGLADPLARATAALESTAPFNPMSPTGALNRANILLPKLLLKHVQGAMGAAEDTGLTPGKTGQFAGNLAIGSLIPGGPLLSGALSGAALSESDNPLGVARDMAFGAAGGKAGSAIMSGVSGLVGSSFKKAVDTMGPEALKAAKTAAYTAVDNAGVRYAKGAFKDLVSGIDDELKAAHLDADVAPTVAAVLKNIKARVGDEPTLTDLDGMRQFVRLNIGGAKNTDAEQFFARKIISNIDEFIGAKFPRTVSGSGEKGAEAIKAARDLNTRFKKVEAVTDAVEAAKLRAGSTGSGGNADNAIRQNLRRVLETTKGLKLDEKAALREAVLGGNLQNAMRLLGKLSPTSGGLSAMLNIGATAANPLMAVGGATGLAAKATADRMTEKAVERVLKVMAAGGDKAALTKPVPKSVAATQKAVRELRAPAARVGAVVAASSNK